MSYILDALKKADAQRELGAVPDLHAHALQPVRAGSAAPRRWLVLVLAVNALLAAGLLVWLSGMWNPSGSAGNAGRARPLQEPAGTAPVAAAPLARTAEAPRAAVPASSPVLPAALPQTVSPAEPVKVAPARADRVYALSELPEEIRRELPVLSITGGMHSENRADRVLIVSGHLFHEGDEITPGLVLEETQPRAAILAYRGYRYRVSW